MHLRHVCAFVCVEISSEKGQETRVCCTCYFLLACSLEGFCLAHTGVLQLQVLYLNEQLGIGSLTNYPLVTTGFTACQDICIRSDGTCLPVSTVPPSKSIGFTAFEYANPAACLRRGS